MNEKDKEIMKSILGKCFAEAEKDKLASNESATNPDVELLKTFSALYTASKEIETTYQSRVDTFTSMAPFVVFVNNISDDSELFNLYMCLKNNLEMSKDMLKDANNKMLTFCQREVLINSQIRDFENKLNEFKDKITSESDAED